MLTGKNVREREALIENLNTHEDPVDIEAWIFVFRAEYLEDD